MTFLTRLIERHRPDGLPSFPLLEPRLASRFEPLESTADPGTLEHDVAIEHPRDADPATSSVRGRARQPREDDGAAVEDLDPRVSALRSTLLAARATVEAPAFPTLPSAPWTMPPRASDGVQHDPASAPEPVELDAPVFTVSTLPEHPRRSVLEPVPDRRPAVSSTVLSERDPGAPREQPTIHVSIGRVEVRAIMTPAAAPPRAAAAVTRLSLEDYLRGGQRGAR